MYLVTRKINSRYVGLGIGDWGLECRSFSLSLLLTPDSAQAKHRATANKTRSANSTPYSALKTQHLN
ncbi:hypothetical protein [Nostoc sp. UHCC 0870]|uniref:hypothetical protein n=1 Tax=Nostoc sp. UHCC 0870 TaxID=2914041 RepID=UPI0030D7E754